MKAIGLIPTRLNSTRLPQKALLEINNIPLVIHTYKRAKLSKKLSDVYICCDDEKIKSVAEKFGAKVMMTSQNHSNGTERINEVYKKLKKEYDFVVDIQGDEPLISPYHIDEVINFHTKNIDADIILPTLQIKPTNNTNIIRVLLNNKNEVLYLSRADIPLNYKKDKKKSLKHLSILSFKPSALEQFAKAKKTYLESIEDIELLRALEIGLKIKSIKLTGDSFSVDVYDDYKKSRLRMSKDKFFKIYK
jgi:3-deoxy-manno-octulosonate cytidylyltransferase (CMP-KDO synthetase)|tara:strand:- start:133 stop:876 length:744 start_codon:yes stop_codon:yes gene_type:complete